MTVSTKQRKALALGVAALVTALLGYALTARERASDGSAGADALGERWDPTGSHPLPNGGVQRAP
jgi:hypothetical protein